MMTSEDFGMHPIFKFRVEVTKEILSLLESVTLGTDGAQYRHLDTRERIYESDNPLFLSMERHTKVLGNVTFCRREKNWYIRYFAFDSAMQAQRKKKSSSNGLLKRELNAFFDRQLNTGEVDSFYAYIDPRNVKSLWMSESFGFRTTGKMATQTYSKLKVPKKERVQMEENPIQIPVEIEMHFQSQRFYSDAQLKKGKHFVIRDESGDLLAFAKTNVAHWEIKRLPGKWGGVTVKLLPYIPFINKLICPKNHSFVVPEAVYVKNNDPQLFTELFNGILNHLNERVIIWWVDETDELYTSIHSKIKWGVLNKMIGVNLVNLVERSNQTHTGVSYTSGFDFI